MIINKIIDELEKTVLKEGKNLLCKRLVYEVHGGGFNDINNAWTTTTYNMRDLINIYSIVLKFIKKYDFSAVNKLNELMNVTDYRLSIFNNSRDIYMIDSNIVTIRKELKEPAIYDKNDVLRLQITVIGPNTKNLLKAINHAISTKYEKTTIQLNQKNKIYYVTEEGSWIARKVTNEETIEDVIFPQKEELVQKLKSFDNSSKIYKKYNKSYSYNILLKGKPGTGKTSIIRAISHDMKIPIFFISPDSDYIRFIKYYIQNLQFGDGKVMLVFEEFDMFFADDLNQGRSDRWSKTKDEKLNFLMQYLDGMCSGENVINIFTSNHPEKIDSRILRSGRIDAVFDFDYLSYENSLHLFDKFNIRDYVRYDILRKYQEEINQVGPYDNIKYNPAKLENMILTYLTQKEK